MANEINGYDLSRAWFDWCFENPEKIKPNHAALYFFCIEHCNRLGWKEKFGLPTGMAKEAIGIRSYNTFIDTLSDLCEWGFLILIEKSRNQYSSNIIAISNFNKALNKALDKALIKHGTKQSESTYQSTSESISSIDKQRTKNKEQRTSIGSAIASLPINEREINFMNCCSPFVNDFSKETVRAFFDYWSEKNNSGKKMKWELQQTFEISKRLSTWKRKEKDFTGGGAKISRMQILKDEGDLAEEVLRQKYANE